VLRPVLRDFDTFFDAVERLPYPAAIARPDFAALRAHGSRFSRPLDRLPKQVRLLEHDPREYRSQAEVIMGARLVVVPLLRSCLVASVTPLSAMLLGKCVILTAGPATNGLFTDEVLTVPPRIQAPWRMSSTAPGGTGSCGRKTAAAGYRYASGLGGEPELVARLLDQVCSWYRSRRGSAGASTGGRSH